MADDRRDASLEEFLGGDDGDAAGDPDVPDGNGTAGDAGGVAPATATYRWAPEGEGPRCGACGRAVDGLWRDEGEFVCADCKQW